MMQCSVRKLEDAAHLERELGAFAPLVFDVTDSAAVQAAAQTVAGTLQQCNAPLALLVNNAGISIAPHPVMHMPVNLAHKQFDVNVFGTLNVIQVMIPCSVILQKSQHYAAVGISLLSECSRDTSASLARSDYQPQVLKHPVQRICRALYFQPFKTWRPAGSLHYMRA